MLEARQEAVKPAIPLRDLRGFMNCLRLRGLNMKDLNWMV